MKVKNWNRNTGKFEEITMAEVKYGNSRTDKSKYRPNVSDLTGASGSTSVGEFDFDDGVDDGSKNYLLRNKQADIVELESTANAILNNAKKDKESIEKEAEEYARNEVETAMKEAENTTGIEKAAPRTE